MLNWVIWNKSVLTLTLCIAHLAGAVEYRGVRPPPPMSVLDMTLMLRPQWYWSFGECGVLLHCQCPQVHSGPES